MFKRFRRLRANASIRALVQEVHININDLIYPLFVINGEKIKHEISSMPGVFQMSIDEILKECEVLEKLGIKAIMLFGIPEVKDSIGSDALSDDGIIAKTLREVKKNFPNLYVMTDLCFCEYTDHGHCGIIDFKNHTLKNDATLEILLQQALIHVKNGCDMIAPSGMIDGMISYLRQGLDDNGFSDIPIMSYSTKFASAYYGPFRDVAQSTPSFGDRKTYQMSFCNPNEAILESLEDEAEGADILMVKPALAYLDIVTKIKQNSLLPLAVYNVSGEYAMLQAAKKAKIIDYEKVMMETMIGFKRAGADLIITYHAKEVAEILKKEYL